MHRRQLRFAQGLHRLDVGLFVGKARAHGFQQWGCRPRNVDLGHSQLGPVGPECGNMDLVLDDRVALARQHLTEAEFGGHLFDALEVLVQRK